MLLAYFWRLKIAYVCVCVSKISKNRNEKEARVYAICTSEPPGAGPQLGGGADFPFAWTSTLCLVGLDQGQRACPASPPVAPLFSPLAESKSSYTTSRGCPAWKCTLKISQSKKVTSRVVGAVAQCQWGVCMCRCTITCDPWSRSTALPCPFVGCPGAPTLHAEAAGAGPWLHQQPISSCGNSTESSKQ